MIKLDEYANIALFCNRIEIGYFDSFGVEPVSEEVKEFVQNKSICTFRTFVLDSLILC